MTGKKRQLSILAAFLLGAVFGVVNTARAAAAPDFEILYPAKTSSITPTYLADTAVQYEIQLTQGDPTHKFKVTWDFGWDPASSPDLPFDPAAWGYVEATVGPFSGTTVFPIRHYTHSAAGGLQVPWIFPSTAPSPPPFPGFVPLGIHQFRVQVTDVTELPNLTSPVHTSSVAVTDALSLYGYTWFGAATPVCAPGSAKDGQACSLDADCAADPNAPQPSDKCGSDAVGWTSFRCQNETTSCAITASTYAVDYAPTSAGHGALVNNAWLGEGAADGGTVNTLGWLTLNQGVCVGGSTAGDLCQNSSQCGGGGACDRTPPARPEDPEGWAATPELERVYTAQETIGSGTRFAGQLAGWARLLNLRTYGQSLKFCDGGANAGKTCQNAGDCPGGACVTPDDWGWVHLRGPEAPTKVCIGGSRNGEGCVSSSQCDPPFGTCKVPATRYSDLSANGYQLCVDCSDGSQSSVRCNLCNSVETVSAVKKSFACNSCYDCNGETGTCNSCESCSLYGVSYDAQQTRLLGYAWSGGERAGGDANEAGLGWMQFNPKGAGIGALQAWLATRYGDIFVGGNIAVSTPPIGNAPNATYLIQANGTISSSFQSKGGAPYVQPGYPVAIPLPSESNRYFLESRLGARRINVLGRLNLQEMTKPGTNRYGKTVVIMQLKDIPGWTIDNTVLKLPLNGTIYVVEGNLTIPDSGDYTSVEFQHGASATTSGAGTIIVNGNLDLQVPVTYNSAPISESILQLPSLAWIIRGNITVSPSVGQLDGAFLVLGCQKLSFCTNTSDNDGVLKTGDDRASQKQLVVNGLLMARKFSFQRTFQSSEGSERVLYDGRLIANPPPGLSDLSAVLPDVREVTP